MPVQVALEHSHLTGGNFELPAVGPIFEDYVRRNGLNERLRFYPGNFFNDKLPSADVLVMGHILHDWNMEEKRVLLQKAFDALPAGGALIVYEALIDDDRRENTLGLLMSLNMLIEDARWFRLFGSRLFAVDARGRVPKNVRGAFGRAGFDGGRLQITRS